MKAEHEVHVVLDRISTREELCEVIDLLCDTNKPGLTSGLDKRRRPTELETISSDPTYEIDLDGDGYEEAEEVDELVTLTDFLPGGTGWLN